MTSSQAVCLNKSLVTTFLLLDKAVRNEQCLMYAMYEFHQFCPTELFLPLLECGILRFVYALYFILCQTEGRKIAILDANNKYSCSKKSPHVTFRHYNIVDVIQSFYFIVFCLLTHNKWL